MIKSNRCFLLCTLFIFFIVVSCTKYQQLLRSDDHELKYKKALEYYEDEQYDRTIRLLSDIMPVYRGTDKAEELNYYNAMAHYKQGDYIMASHYFETFVSSYPRSEHAEKFSFLSAYCKYLESPRYSLDQSVTREAIQELQNFINRYPNSDKVSEANDLIDELRFKLEKKRFEKARLYYAINDFRAAVRTFDNLIKDFPGTAFEEEALFYILKSYHDFARMSIAERQPERYEKAVEAYDRLISNFPETKFINEADKMLENAKKHIKDKDLDDIIVSEPN